MTQEQKDILNHYAELKKDIKELEIQAEELNKEVLAIMQESEVEEISVSDLGKLSLGARRSWKYSDKVVKLDELLKETKKTEERTGEASYQEKFYVIFKHE